MVIAADVFSLFIGLTLAGSSMPLVKGISAVCTVGILVVIMADFAVKTARDDIKNRRDVSDGKKIVSAFGMGLSASAPAFLSWIILYISVGTVNGRTAVAGFNSFDALSLLGVIAFVIVGMAIGWAIYNYQIKKYRV